MDIKTMDGAEWEKVKPDALTASLMGKPGQFFLTWDDAGGFEIRRRAEGQDTTERSATAMKYNGIKKRGGQSDNYRPE